MKIIPAIDIYDEKVVRLSKGDFKEVSFYHKDPVRQAMIFREAGFDLIHIVDLEGAKTGKFKVLNIINEIKKRTGVKIQFGGGIRDGKTASQAFGAGIDFAVIGSISVKNQDEFKLIVEKYTPGKIITAADVIDENVYISGWREKASVSLNELIGFCIKLGIDKFICTDISQDGTLTGLNTGLYQKLMSQFPLIKIIASGGVKDIDEIKKVKKINPYAVVVGKAIYEGKIDLKELAEFGE